MSAQDDKNAFIGVLIVLAIILAGKLAWAKLAHDDFRCAFAECRIETR